MAKTRAQENRAIRQEALREQLASQGHLQHVYDIANELSKPETEPKDVQRLKVKADIHMKLVDKYLPSLKGVELSTDPENPLDLRWSIEVVGAKDNSP